MESLTLEMTVYDQDATTRNPPSKSEELYRDEVLIAAAKTFSAVAFSPGNSGLEVQSINIFNGLPQSLCCSLHYDAFNCIECTDQTYGSSFGGMRILSMSVTGRIVDYVNFELPIDPEGIYDAFRALYK